MSKFMPLKSRCAGRFGLPKFLLAIAVCIFMLCGNAFAATNHTVDEAISWCYAQLGQSIDVDGAPMYQCVDLIKAYYSYLGVYPVSGNGKDYSWNDLPSGWTRVQGGTPQRGDILVYGPSEKNQWGHVAIFEDTYSTFHQNFDGPYVQRITKYSYTGFTNPYWGYIRPDWKSAHYDGVAQKLVALHERFPTGMHWNHVRAQAGDDGDSLKDSFNNSYSDYITGYGCKTHNGVADIGDVDCNAFDGAIQCEGFARKIYYEVFGQLISQQYNNKRYDIENIMHGDFIHLPNHSAIVLSAEGDELVIFEANYDINNDGKHLCMINWGRRVKRSSVEYFYHASNWEEVYFGPNARTALNVSGVLDGNENETTEGYGTFDVYVDGVLVADDKSDYSSTELRIGASYEISDIRPLGGKAYDSMHSGALTGTLTAAGANVSLAFSTCGVLDIQFMIDGVAADSIDGVGSFDVIINGDTTDETDAVSYNKSWPQGTRYEITNVQACDGMFFDDCVGALSGTLGAGETTVTLNFSTIVPVTGEWHESNTLPGYVDPEKCEIEYKHTYTVTSQTSPGAEWTQTNTITTYEDSGVPYYSDFPLTTSDTVVYKGMYYYHFCGATTGNRVNFAWTDAFNVYHEAGETYMFDVLGEWADDDNPNYRAYQLRWNQGQWAGGNANCADGRANVWYIRYRYQNRVAVTTYEWSRTTDWETTLDDTATSVRYRYRLKDTQAPVITEVNVTEVTPFGYTIQCIASDDNSVSKIVFASWTELETEAEAKVQEIVPVLTDAGYEASLTVSIADHGNMRDCNYYTGVKAYDAAGNVVEYDVDAVRRYIPTLVHSENKLELPDNLVSIEASAFDGDAAFGEVMIPDGVQRIDERAFAGCARLTIAYIPDSVQYIEPTAFDDCPDVVLICPAGSVAAEFALEYGIPYVTAEE